MEYESAIYNALFKFATNNDGFRCWYYPDFPRDYLVNEQVPELISQCERAFLSVADAIVKIKNIAKAETFSIDDETLKYI